MNADDLARFLRANPQFFDQHPELLESIHVPHPYGGRAIPLAERQTVALREKVKGLEGKLGSADQRRLGTESPGHDPDQPARGRQRPAIELAVDGRGHVRMDPLEEAAEDHQAGVQDVDQAGQPDPEPASRLRERGQVAVGPGRGGVEQGVDLGRTAEDAPSRPPEEGHRPDLGLPAADGAAGASPSVRVDREMADLAAVPRHAGKRPAIDDQPAADAHLARDEEDVVGAGRDPAPGLRDRHALAHAAGPPGPPSVHQPYAGAGARHPHQAAAA